MTKQTEEEAEADGTPIDGKCPRCGADLEYDEVDIGVGTLRGNPGCPECHWVPAPAREPTP